MASVPLDTLRTSRRLRDAGFTEPQAEAVVTAISENGDRLARETVPNDRLGYELGLIRSETRAEFGLVRSEAKAELDLLRTEVKAEFGLVRAEMKAIRAEVKLDIEEAVSPLRSDIYVLKSMAGLGLTMGGAILLKLFLS